MYSALKHPVSIVLFALVCATALSWWLGHGSADGGYDAPLISMLLLLLVTFIKVRLVMSYFMEVQHAPVILKIACDSWIVISGATIAGMYALTLAGAF